MREYRFDVARVICMTYIVTYVHLYEYIYPHDPASYNHVSVAMAHACLGVFTFVSGYLLGKKYCFGQQGNTNVWNFYEKRILRIVPLFVVSSFLLWMVDFNDADATLNGLLCISPFVNPKPMTIYYIPIILWCYLVTPLVARRSLKWRLWACLFLYALLVVARCVFPSIDIRMVFNVFFYFVGIVSASCFDWKLSTSYGTAIKTVAGLTLVLLIAAAILFSLKSTFWQLVIGATGVLVILFVCDDMSKLLFDTRDTQDGDIKAFAARIICLVSYASMACYMFHRFFYWLAPKIWNPSVASVKWVYMVGIVFPVIVAISYAIQKLYDSLAKKKKSLMIHMLLFVVLGILGLATYHFVDREFMVAKEVPYYRVGPRPDDDTIRVAVIGDSWAQFHKSFNCDALFEQYAGKWTQNKVKCQSCGKGGAMSKEVYHLMFRNHTPESSWPDGFCTQPLIEEHPDYCVVMTGINDTWKKRPVSYYAGNCRLIIRLLLANDIRPVVMEIPDFEMGKWLDTNRRPQRFIFRLYSYFTDVVEDDITPFRKGLINMLNETGLADSVLFIPANNWLPEDHHYSEDIYQIDHVHLNYQGYHFLDSCMASEIIKDYENRKRIQRIIQ